VRRLRPLLIFGPGAVVGALAVLLLQPPREGTPPTEREGASRNEFIRPRAASAALRVRFKADEELERLRAENERLMRQIAELRARPPDGG